jgi:cysteine desulfurase
MLARRGRHIITSSIEHDAVLEPIKKLASNGWEVTILPPNDRGYIPAEDFADALREDTVFASIMLVNNETGAINPVEDYSREIKRRRLGTLLHTDAVQGLCKIPFTVKTLEAELISISAHKLHGPKGVGALYIKGSIKLPPMLLGGSQENGKRAGTEALPAIVGFGEAALLASMEREDNTRVVSELRDHIIMRLKEELHGVVIISKDGSEYILSISLPGYKSEVLMNYLEGEGICVSKSAACKKGARSRVLEAMRLENEVIDGALRISFSRYNTKSEAEYFVQALKRASTTLRK